MKLLNFEHNGRGSYGALTQDGRVTDLRGLDPQINTVVGLIRAGRLEQARDAVARASATLPLDTIRVTTPLGHGLRYFCIGVNYPDRNEEYQDGAEHLKFPSLFFRTHSSFADPGAPIVLPRESEQLDYEGEIVVVIGEGGRRIAREHAMAHVFGYSCANEGSVRDWLRHSKFNVTQGKNFDRSGSIGPWIVTADELDGGALHLTTRVNGEPRQSDISGRMIFPIDYLIHYLSAFCTLEPGDVILTGTPSGAGARINPPRYLRAGDVVEVEVSGIGVLRNQVVDDEKA